MPKHTNNATAVIEDHASLQSNFTGVLKHGSGKTLTVGKHTKKLDNRAHLAIILLVEESMCLLRYGRARHDHLHDLTILAALLAQVLYNLEGSTRQLLTRNPETCNSSQLKATEFFMP